MTIKPNLTVFVLYGKLRKQNRRMSFVLTHPERWRDRPYETSATGSGQDVLLVTTKVPIPTVCPVRPGWLGDERSNIQHVASLVLRGVFSCGIAIENYPYNKSCIMKLRS
jgi:hypothetical protein